MQHKSVVHGAVWSALRDLRRPRASARSLVALALITAACGSESERDAGAPAADTSGPEIAATIGGRGVSVGEVDEWIRDQLFAQATRGNDAMRLYELRKRALEEMADAQAAEAEAARTGRSAEELLRADAESRAEVSDEEVRAYYEANKQRFRNLPYERVAAAARLQLETQRQMEAKREHAKELRGKIDLQIRLEPPRYPIATRGTPRGAAEAFVTLVEFGDYECPLCKAAEPVVSELLARYPAQLRFHFLHFPRDSRPLARPAAIAAECAADQGKFWELHAALFANSPHIASEKLPAIAASAGLDTARWKSCFASQKPEGVVRADIAAAMTARAEVAPAFFVNGIPFTGRRTVEGLSALIDEELARQQRRASR
jgi:protein-disulfide isomerase